MYVEAMILVTAMYFSGQSPPKDIPAMLVPGTVAASVTSEEGIMVAKKKGKNLPGRPVAPVRS